MFSHKEEDYHENWFYRLWKYGDSHVKGNSEKWRGGSIRYDRFCEVRQDPREDREGTWHPEGR